MRRIALITVATFGMGLARAASTAVTAADTTLADGLVVSGSVNLVYSPIDAGDVILEINGREVLSATEPGTYVWTPERTGTYVLVHRAGETVFARKVVYGGADDAKELEIGWLGVPVSMLFPNSYALVTNVVIESTVTQLPEGAFAGCAALSSVTIPSGVTNIWANAFSDCGGLTNVVFGGNAPTVVASAFTGVKSGCTATVCEGTTGWDDDGDGKWQGLTLVYRSKNPIPDIGENPTQEAIAEALSVSADPMLATNITDGATYAAYRAWADTVTNANGQAAGALAVKESPNAWVSFAFGQGALLEAAPTEEDLTVEAFVPAAEDGKFDFTVSVEGVKVGDAATKENLKKVFGLEGGSSLQGLSSDNVDVTFGTPKDGKVKFTAGPKDASQTTFFMKVRMK